MLRMLALIVLVVFTSNLVADEKTNKVLKDLQGDWKFEKLVTAGEEKPAKNIDNVFFTIKENTMTIKVSDSAGETWTFEINVEKKPTWIDVETKRQKFVGVYELNGDTLKFCWVEFGNRPTEFESTKKNAAELIILKRVKK